MTFSRGRAVGGVALAGMLAAFAGVARGQASAPVPPCCPDRAAYIAAVRAFAAGDRAAAAAALAHASPAEMKRAADQLLTEGPRPLDFLPLVRAAAVMHVALAASARQAGNLDAMAVQLRIGNTIFRMIPVFGFPLDPPFRAAWYTVASLLCLSEGNFEDARTYAVRGLNEKVHGVAAAIPADMHLVEGIVEEVRADWNDRIAGEYPGDVSALREHAAELAEAERAYRQTDRASEEACLRFGRVLSLEGKTAEAHRTLDALLKASHDSRIVYLIHLFLADLASRRADTAAAVREYTDATAATPSLPVAYIGLANVTMRAGDRRRAREYIRQWAARSGSDREDPWVKYRSGLDLLSPTVSRLVAMVSK